MANPSFDVIDDPGRVGIVEEHKIRTVASCYPGRFVIKDTSDDGIKVSGANGLFIGVLGYGETAAPYKPTTRDTIYALSDFVAVHKGIGFRFRAVLTTSQTIVKGAPLEVGALGTVQALSAGVKAARADESVTTTGAEAAIWCIRE